MTNRINTLTVVLEKPIKEDDVEGIIQAIEQIRGVLQVETSKIENENIIRMQEKFNLRKELWEIMKP